MAIIHLATLIIIKNISTRTSSQTGLCVQGESVSLLESPRSRLFLFGLIDYICLD